MLKQKMTIINQLGLHARASSKFTQVANKFKSEVWVAHHDRRVNGKSIMGLMMLAATCGSIIELEVNGADEQAAMEALTHLINHFFDEEK